MSKIVLCKQSQPNVRSRVLGGSAALALITAVLVGGGLVASGNSSPVIAQTAATALQVITPATFTSLAQKVKTAVVSIQVAGQRAPRSDYDREHRPPSRRGGPDGRPFDGFFKRFFDDPRFGDRSDRREFERRYSERRDGQRRPRHRGAQGSGFIISADGYVVTNHHVIDGGGDITVIMDDGRKHTAKLIGTDKRTDLAVLKIDGKNLPHVGWTDDAPQVGEWVMAVGNPFGLGGTVTTGIISASGRAIGAGPYDDFIQIDAAVNRGNSGGPTFNLDGEVIGVNTAIYSPSGGSVGIGFAISAKLAKDVVADLLDDGDITRGWLGVSIQDVTPEIAESLGLAQAGGALVSDITDGSPAEKSGLRLGDTVLKVDGGEISSTRDLARTIAAIKPGKTAGVTIWRDGKEQLVNVDIGTLPGQERLAAMQRKDSGGDTPESASFSALGFEVAPLGDEDDGGGVVVARVRPGSDAEDKGFRAGDRIIAVAGTHVATVADFDSAVEAASKDGPPSILVLVRSNDRQRFVSLKLDNA